MEKNRQPREQISEEDKPLQEPFFPAQHGHMIKKYIFIVFRRFYEFGPIL